MNMKQGETNCTTMPESGFSKPQLLTNSTVTFIGSSNHETSMPSCENVSTPKPACPENTVSIENVTPSDNQNHLGYGAQSNNLSHLKNVVPNESTETGNSPKTCEYITRDEVDDISNNAPFIESTKSCVASFGSIKSHSVHFEDQFESLVKEREKTDHHYIDSNDCNDFQTNHEGIQSDDSFHVDSSYEGSNGTDDEFENSDSDSVINMKNDSPDCSVVIEKTSNATLFNDTINVTSDQFDTDYNAAEQFPQSYVKINETSIISDQPLETDNENHAIDTLVATPSNDRIGNVREDGSASVHDEVTEGFDIESDPPCISEPLYGNNVTTDDILKWIDGTLKYLNSHERFSSLIDATWSKSIRTEFRGLQDDPKTGHSALFRDLQLKQLFYLLSKSCPLAKSYMAQHSTSLKGVWKLVFHHFGFYDYEC